jgi:hypothetical protein
MSMARSLCDRHTFPMVGIDKSWQLSLMSVTWHESTRRGHRRLSLHPATRTHIISTQYRHDDVEIVGHDYFDAPAR